MGTDTQVRGDNKRRGRLRLACALVVLGAGACRGGQVPLQTAPTPSVAPIVLDGDFADWGDHWAIVDDPEQDGASGGIDLRSVQVANDADYVYLAVELDTVVALNDVPTIEVYIDTDSNVETGRFVEGIGADVVWDIGRQEGEHLVGTSTTSLKTRNLGFRVAPTVDARRFEVAFSRTASPAQDSPIFVGEAVEIVLKDSTYSAGDRVPDMGAISYTIDDAAPSVSAISFDRESSDHIRVMSYNVERPGFDDQEVRDEFARIFQAIQPDVILLQEQDNERLALSLIDQWLPLEDGDWYMESLTDKVTLSRFPIQQEWPQSRGQLHERILATLIEREDGQRVALLNAHLSCCEDDVSRQREADSFISFIREQQRGEPGTLENGTPFLLAGDFNLVMTQQPLDTLLGGEVIYSAFGDSNAPDWDGSWLADAVPRHSHQAMTYTWRSDFSWYWPGRLDFCVYTDSVLTLEKAFVVDAESMDAGSLAALGLLQGDTHAAADHLPLVMDFSFR